MSDETIMPFDFPAENPTIIKVIGVGGGGGNAVNHMYKEGIHDVTFVVCNTDNQALAESPVPVKLQLGKEGLGAGNRPERAREAAEESIEDVKGMLNDGCKMVFITAGMGGGTGTGAAPIIAKTAKDMDILTVGIVTIPFLFEGNRKIDQALDGVEKMSQHVDALLVINNERLRDIYSDFSVMNAFGKADDTLSIAAKSIAEIITIRGTINLDFNDVKTVLKDGGVAIMSTGYGKGESRVSQAINDALHSPLLNNNDIFNSKKILFNISFSTKSELMMEEMNEVHDFMSKFGTVCIGRHLFKLKRRSRSVNPKDEAVINDRFAFVQFRGLDEDRQRLRAVRDARCRVAECQRVLVILNVFSLNLKDVDRILELAGNRQFAFFGIIARCRLANDRHAAFKVVEIDHAAVVRCRISRPHVERLR